MTGKLECGPMIEALRREPLCGGRVRRRACPLEVPTS